MRPVTIGWSSVPLVVAALGAVLGAGHRLTLQSSPSPSPSPSIDRRFTLNALQHTGVHSFSPDGTRALSTDHSTVIVRDARSGAWLQQIHATDRVDLWSVAWSPRGDRLVTTTRSGVVRVWDAARGALLDERPVWRQADFSRYLPDGRILSVGTGEDGRDGVEVWSAESSTPIRFAVGHEQRAVAVSDDGQRIAIAATKGDVGVWDPATGKQVARLPHPGNVIGLTLLAGNRLVVVDWKRVAVWDLATSRMVRSLEAAEGPWFVRPSPDGNVAFVTYRDSPLVRAWDTRTGALLTTITLEREPHNVLLSRDGSRLVTSDDTVRVWDARSGALVHSFDDLPHAGGISLSPDGALLSSSHDDHDARLWDLRSGRLLTLVGGHSAGVTSITFAPQGGRFVTGSDRMLGWDKSARLWDGEAGRLLGTFHHDGLVSAAAFSPDGRVLVTASQDGHVRRFDAATVKHDGAFAGHSKRITAVHFSADGSELLTGSLDHTARVWRTATTSERLRLEDIAPVMDARFAPDGSWIATAGASGTLSVFDARTGRRRFSREACDEPAYSLEVDRLGRRVVVSCLWSSSLWDPAIDEPIRSLKGGQAHFSPDGAQILTRNSDGTATVWDAESGKRVRTIPVSERNVRFVAAWTPDGLGFVAGDERGRVTWWDLASGRQLAASDSHPGGVWTLAFDPSRPSRLVTGGEFGYDMNATGSLAVFELSR